MRRKVWCSESVVRVHRRICGIGDNMEKSEVIALMESSKSDREWNANCDKVKEACNGYPDYWYSAIVLSGLCDRVSAKYGGSGSKITISTL